MRDIFAFLFRCFYSVIVRGTDEQKDSGAITLVIGEFASLAIVIFIGIYHWFAYDKPIWFCRVILIVVVVLVSIAISKYFNESRVKAIKNMFVPSPLYRIAGVFMLVFTFVFMIAAIFWIAQQPRILR